MDIDLCKEAPVPCSGHAVRVPLMRLAESLLSSGYERQHPAGRPRCRVLGRRRCGEERWALCESVRPLVS